ncbi:MAG: hypothetical protein ACYTET_04490, partial [Planctomycetota bacterium]
MKWFKDKLFRTLMGVGVLLFLSGIPFLYLSSKAGSSWIKLGVYLGMAGGGFIGLAIAIRIMCRTKEYSKPDENLLKQKAWKDLAIRFYSFIVGGLSFYYLIVHSDKISGFNSLAWRIIMVLLAI